MKITVVNPASPPFSAVPTLPANKLLRDPPFTELGIISKLLITGDLSEVASSNNTIISLPLIDKVVPINDPETNLSPAARPAESKPSD